MKTITTFLLFFATMVAVAQTKLNYDVLLFNKKIGETTVEKIEKENGLTLYKLRSRSEAKILFTSKKSMMTADILVKDGELYNSYYQAVNDEGETLTKVAKGKDGYDADQNGRKYCIRKAIRNCSTLLYFTEPKNLVSIFSERLGEFFALEKSADSEYKSVIKNVTSYYRYINGKLMEVEMSKPLGSVYLRLTN